jgi:hypothetical protein
MAFCFMRGASSPNHLRRRQISSSKKIRAKFSLFNFSPANRRVSPADGGLPGGVVAVAALPPDGRRQRRRAPQPAKFDKTTHSCSFGKT